ncbi:carboxypeptidase B-like [Hyposmocoma kahamanoa]|uniref:carboxypeptidase B-like n=1 Tax=Hyposmocoma kahamanoa TaxID=1477025 RepID=UPI000E6D8980|nr:carboxypeptidase B-like [Hyposmocoma kahamanoa]
MPRNNLEKTNMDSARKTKKKVPSKGKSHTSKLAKTKKERRISENTRDRVTKHKGVLIDWRHYHTLSTIYDFLHYLEMEYPAICTVRDIGRSLGGLAIKMLKISNTDETNRPVWLDGTIHSREWISTSVVTFIAHLIAKNFERLPSYITNKDWYIVPVLNPDGYCYTQYVRLWRKNRAICNREVVGVDLNRNFSYEWGTNEDEGSSSLNPQHSRYRGPMPFSEPESAAVRNFIMKLGKQFEIFLTFHSPEQAITIPWCYTSEPCPDYVKLMQGGAVMAKAIYQTTGRIYKVGTFRDTIYCGAGTSLDWSYGSAKIPFSYLIELRKGGKRFILPETQIFDTCKETMVAVESLMKFVDESQNKELKLYQPCFSKHDNDNCNYSLTRLLTSDDALVLIRKNPRMCKYNTQHVDKTSKRYRYTKPILYSKSLSTKRKIPFDTKDKYSVHAFSGCEDENLSVIDVLLREYNNMYS